VTCFGSSRTIVYHKNGLQTSVHSFHDSIFFYGTSCTNPIVDVSFNFGVLLYRENAAEGNVKLRN